MDNINTLLGIITKFNEAANAAYRELISYELRSERGTPIEVGDINIKMWAHETANAVDRAQREIYNLLDAHAYIEGALGEDVGQGGVPRKRNLARLYAVAHSPKSGAVLSAAAKDVANEAYRRGYRDEKVAEVIPEKYLRQYFALGSVRKKQVAEALRNGDTWDTVMRRM